MLPLFQRFSHYAALALLLSWNVLLVGYRMHATGQSWFTFFLWNLLLAVIPYLSSDGALFFAHRNRRWLSGGLLLLTVLFLPNAPYIITDLFHLRVRAEMPLWYDTMILFSMALSGLLLYYMALFNVRISLALLFNTFVAECSIFLISFLCGFGIYLGRYLRFNSWDLLSNPNDLVDEITDRLINSSVHTRTVGVTLLYGAFLWMGYWVIRLYRVGLGNNTNIGVR